MRMLRPAGYPANRTAGRWVFDALVTVAAAAPQVADLLRETPRPPASAFVVLALIVAPLLVRRIWPIPVFGWVLATSIPAGLWNRHLFPFWKADLSKHRSFAECGPRTAVAPTRVS